MGFQLAALHHGGPVALTRTPSPMVFLSEVLERPVNGGSAQVRSRYSAGNCCFSASSFGMSLITM